MESLRNPWTYGFTLVIDAQLTGGLTGSMGRVVGPRVLPPHLAKLSLEPQLLRWLLLLTAHASELTSSP